MSEKGIFDDLRYARVSIDYLYIQKLTFLLSNKKLLGDWSEIEEFVVNILFHIANFNRVWIDKEGNLR
jgi:hypothetical protein